MKVNWIQKVVIDGKVVREVQRTNTIGERVRLSNGDLLEFAGTGFKKIN